MTKIFPIIHLMEDKKMTFQYIHQGMCAMVQLKVRWYFYIWILNINLKQVVTILKQSFFYFYKGVCLIQILLYINMTCIFQGITRTWKEQELNVHCIYFTCIIYSTKYSQKNLNISPNKVWYNHSLDIKLRNISIHPDL